MYDMVFYGIASNKLTTFVSHFI